MLSSLSVTSASAVEPSDADLAAIAKVLEVEVPSGFVVTEAVIDQGGSGYVVMEGEGAEFAQMPPGKEATTRSASTQETSIGIAAGCSANIRVTSPYKSGNKALGTISAQTTSGCSTRTACQDFGPKIGGLWWLKSHCGEVRPGVTKVLAYSMECEGTTRRTWGNMGVWGSETLPDPVTATLSCTV